MKLPNAKNAIVDDRKLQDYLLSDTHPVGRFKAKVFRKAGFDESNITLFRELLLTIGRENDVDSFQSTECGFKYGVRGILSGPNGELMILTVWIVETGQNFPRLVTAYPQFSQTDASSDE